ncbi:MAG TPA: DUF6510 family protein [Glaciihabitans sp.]|jgi:hypothetical protein|nr:DUF6510 family protein [Glaciihabitans sp.]
MSNHVDGNALAGPLSELFRVDVTSAEGSCAGCGDTAVLACALVYPDPMGFVARCRSCDAVLLTLVLPGDNSEHGWVELNGFARLRIEA